MTSDFTRVLQIEPLATGLAPLMGFAQTPLLALPAAVDVAMAGSERLRTACADEFVADLSDFARAAVAFAAAKRAAPGCAIPDADAIAALHLFTMDSPLYGAMNAALRSEQRADAKPFFPLLRLLLTAVSFLEPRGDVVLRGVRRAIAGEYAAGAAVTWHAFSTATASARAVDRKSVV